MDVKQDRYPENPTPLEHEAYEWVVKFVSGRAKPADLSALQAWSARSPAHAVAFDQARRVWQTLDPARRRLLLHNVVAFTPAAHNTVAAPARLGRRAFVGGAIAASVVGAAAVALQRPLDLWPSLPELVADYRTQTGERRQLTLAQNVSVDMNTQTSIALRPLPENADRFELVSGEALISAPKAAVTVLAGAGEIVGSQARFNVRHIDGSVFVTCLEGQISVTAASTTAALLADQQQAYSVDGLGHPATIDPAIVTAWQDGIVVFDGMSIADVVNEINRYRHGRVILTNATLGRKRFNARFRIENIDRVVGQIAQVFDAKVRTLPGGITLLG